MAAQRYRWHAIETLRSVRRVRAQSTLAQAGAAFEQAGGAVQCAEQALQGHLARMPQSPAEARDGSALELQRAAAFAREHGRVLHELRSALGRARTELAMRSHQLDLARHALADRDAEQRLIERHHQLATRMMQRKQEGREQSELEERIRKRAHRPS